MDKSLLLICLSATRFRAEAAYLETVVQSMRIAELESQGRDATVNKVQLKAAENDDQRSLKEMTWLLDQMDKLDQ